MCSQSIIVFQVNKEGDEQSESERAAPRREAPTREECVMTLDAVDARAVMGTKKIRSIIPHARGLAPPSLLVRRCGRLQGSRQIRVVQVRIHRSSSSSSECIDISESWLYRVVGASGAAMIGIPGYKKPISWLPRWRRRRSRQVGFR